MGHFTETAKDSGADPSFKAGLCQFGTCSVSEKMASLLRVGVVLLYQVHHLRRRCSDSARYPIDFSRR